MNGDDRDGLTVVRLSDREGRVREVEFGGEAERLFIWVYLWTFVIEDNSSVGVRLLAHVPETVFPLGKGMYELAKTKLEEVRDHELYEFL